MKYIEHSTETILALDTAETTGYAIYKDGKILDSGIWRLRKTQKAGDMRCSDLRDHLQRTIKKYAITKIVPEDIFLSDKKGLENVFKCLGELRGVIRLSAYDNELPEPIFVNPLCAKRYMLGLTEKQVHHIPKDKQKESMTKRVTELGYKLHTTKDDEADAIGILLTYLHSYGYAPPVKNK